jgi:glycyl-tRNA synthetase beta chain
MQQPLLIEIGVEELPAIPLLKILKQIQNSWADILTKYKLECEFEFFYTPRRLVLKHKAFPAKQQDSNIELFGPPLQIAIKDGNPTPAGLGFAKKCGVEFDELQRVEKNNKEILYYQKQEIGLPSKELLEDMINEWISSMSFGKMMRWGSRSDEFIRPVRWLQVRLANESVEVELFGVKSDKNTYVHRMVSYEPQLVSSVDDYEQILSMGAVMLNQKDRYDLIVSEFDDIETRAYVTIDRDKALLDEVVAITENPKALLGSFDESFLQLPPEVIITSMKEHQRYFPVFKDGKITNKFVVVSNAYTDDYSKVIAGNERVLKPRLADGLFFYENDLRNGLSIDGL